MAKDPRVVRIQERLVKYDFDVGKIDGVLGERTEGAILNALNELANLRVFEEGTKPVVKNPPKFKTLIPSGSLPVCDMKRVHIHWTAGSYTASEVDLEHYHFLVNGNGEVLVGDHSVKDNSGTLREGQYAAHTLNANSGAIGVSFCAMAGAIEGKTNGPYPIKKEQYDVMLQVIAQLCYFYAIPVTPRTVLTHAEVQTNLGVKQRGKWDITVLPFDASIKGAEQVGNYIRAGVQALL